MTNISFDLTVLEFFASSLAVIAIVGWWGMRTRARELEQIIAMMAVGVADGELTFKRDPNGKPLPVKLNQVGKPNAN